MEADNLKLEFNNEILCCRLLKYYPLDPRNMKLKAKKDR